MSVVTLPGVGWLYVHEVIVRPLVDGEEADDEGRTTDTYGDPSTVRGYVSAVDREDVTYAGGAGTRITAVVRVALDETVAPGDSVTINGVAPRLDGRYFVDLLRPTVVDLRVLLSLTRPGDA